MSKRLPLPDTTPDGRPIVQNFGARAFTPGAIRPVEDQRQDWAREHGISMSGARLIGDMTLLEVGCLIWSTERRVGPGMDDEPMGGVIVQKTQSVSDDGEVVRTFRCVDPYRMRPRLLWRTLTPNEIDRESMELAEDGLVRSVVRRLAEEIAKSKGPLTPALIDIDRWQHNLVAVLAGAAA